MLDQIVKMLPKSQLKGAFDGLEQAIIDDIESFELQPGEKETTGLVYIRKNVLHYAKAAMNEEQKVVRIDRPIALKDFLLDQLQNSL